MSFVAARYLGPAAFGLLGLVQWTRVTGAMLLDVGISSATTKFTAELVAHRRDHGRPALLGGARAMAPAGE